MSSNVGESDVRFLTNSRYLGIRDRSVGDVEETDKGLVVNLRQCQLDLVARRCHIAQRPENLGPKCSDGD